MAEERFSSRRGQTLVKSVAIRTSSVQRLRPLFKCDESVKKLTGLCALRILVDDFHEFCNDDTRSRAKLKDRQRVWRMFRI